MEKNFDIDELVDGRIIRFRDDITKVKGASCAYLILGSKANILIDCLSGRHNLYDEIDHNKPLVLLLTHAHIDHIGGVVDFIGKAKIYIHYKEADFLRTGTDMHPEVIAKDVVKHYTLPKLKFPKVPEILELHSGDQFNFGDGEDEIITCIETPGHSVGSMCFYTKAFGGTLFTGDTYYDENMKNYIYPRSEESKRFPVQKQSIFSLFDTYKHHLMHVFTGHNYDEDPNDLTNLEVFVKKFNKESTQKKAKVACCICSRMDEKLYRDEDQPHLIFCGRPCQKYWYFN